MPVPASRVARGQPIPVPVARAAKAPLVPAHVPVPTVTQPTSAPVPIPRVGVTGTRSAPVPIPVPRVRPAKTQSTAALVPVPWVRSPCLKQQNKTKNPKTLVGCCLLTKSQNMVLMMFEKIHSQMSEARLNKSDYHINEVNTTGSQEF